MGVAVGLPLLCPVAAGLRLGLLLLLVVVVVVLPEGGSCPTPPMRLMKPTPLHFFPAPRRPCCRTEAEALSSSASSFTHFSTDEQRKRQKNLIIP